MNISPTQITTVIQGPIYPNITQKVIDSVKRFLPETHIIFATCDITADNKITGYDELIAVSDPGAFEYPDKPNEKPNNLNRQIANTLAGLKAVKTPYTFKLRSDFILTGADFLTYFDLFPKSNKKDKIFNHKLLASCYFSRNPRKETPFPLHPSDFTFFGYTTDLLRLYDVPLMTQEQAYGHTSGKHPYRYVPEQYLFINCMKKAGIKPSARFYNDCSIDSIEQTERLFANNFIFLTFEQFNTEPTKPIFDMRCYPNHFKGCYTHIEWQRLYQQQIDPNLSVPEQDLERAKINYFYKRYKRVLFFVKLMVLFIPNRKRRRKIRFAVLEKCLRNKKCPCLKKSVKPNKLSAI